MIPEFNHFLAAAMRGEDLSRKEARAAFDLIMAGSVSETVMGAFLGALSAKGESVPEVVAAAESMRSRLVKIACPAPCIDTCGTGGDGISTFNTSTTAAIIAAAAGATVAKHGNRSTSRASGSTEALEHLGIDVEADRETVEHSLATVGIGYLNARLLHPAMKHAAPVRAALGVRTIFNLLGPLTNPAGARRQLLGVPSPAIQELVAAALVELQVDHAWVVHGSDGLCDLTLSGETRVIEIHGGAVRRFSVAPEDAGLVAGSLDAIRVDSPAESAATMQDVLEGRDSAARCHALLNAGAAVVVAGLAANLTQGVAVAAAVVDSGAAKAKLDDWRKAAGRTVAGEEKS